MCRPSSPICSGHASRGGTLVEWVRRAAVTLAPVEAQIKAALTRAPVRHSDETGVRQGGRGQGTERRIVALGAGERCVATDRGMSMTGWA